MSSAGKKEGSVSGPGVPALWILTLPFLTFGMLVGFVIVTLPQILVAQGVPGGRIATAVALILSPIFWAFVLAPLLDVRFRRRTYALVFGVLAVCATAFGVLHRASLAEVEGVMLVGFLATCLFQAAVGGWVGSLIDKRLDSRLGAWSTVYNIGGNGIGILISGYATERLSQTLAAGVVSVAFLAPLLVLPVIPAPTQGKMLARGSFLRFAGEIASVLKRREALMALAVFVLPAAPFALTNVLGGWSRSFHASAPFVSLIGGVGLVLGGIVGCSTVPVMARRLPLRLLYLCIGFVGATITLILLLLPRVSATYGFAFVAEGTLQSAAFATGSGIIFETIGPGNPLAATTFALLSAAMSLPLDYMAIVDARGYDWQGITGAFLVDALASVGACVLLALVLGRRLFPAQPSQEAA